MSERIAVELEMSPEQYGALLACVDHAAEQVEPDEEQTFLRDLSDSLRDAQRKVLGPMGIQDGITLTRAIQASERAVSLWLPR